MKKGILGMAAVAALAIGTLAFNSLKSEETVIYKLDTAASTLKWKGDYADGSHSHNGSIKWGAGEVVYAGNTFKSGSFTVDMKSIMTEDLKGAMRDTLNSHLSNSNFFSVKNFPNTTVTVNELTPTEIKATVKLIGKDIPATIPVTMSKDGKSIVAKGSFKLDVSPADIAYMKSNDPSNPKAYVSPVLNFDANLVLKATK